MQCSYRRSIKCAGTLLAILSLAACGGLPKGGERTASTAMKGNERTALAAVVRPRVAAHPGQSGVSRARRCARRHRRATGPGGCGGAQPRCAVFHLEQGPGRQGSARTSAPRGRPRRARAPVARRSRHDALRCSPARDRQSSQHRGADVQPRDPTFAPAARHRRRHRTHQQADAQQVVHGGRAGLHRRRPQYRRRIFRGE